jgi:hypothetical protein
MLHRPDEAAIAGPLSAALLTDEEVADRDSWASMPDPFPAWEIPVFDE